VLLSSLFVYNSVGTIDESAIDRLFLVGAQRPRGRAATPRRPSRPPILVGTPGANTVDSARI
jgi:hypothetical protein